MNKLIQVIVYDTESDTLLSVGDLEFPSISIDDQTTPFDGACKVLNNLGIDACVLVAVYKSDEGEIWQALHFAEMQDFEGEIPDIKWIAPEFVDCKTNGKWIRKFVKNNIPKVDVEHIKEK